MNANSDGDFNFNLGNFENAWNDNNALLCFCNLRDFFSALARRSFVSKAFLPTSKHTTDFVEKQNKFPVSFVVNYFMLPCQLQKKFKQVTFPDGLRDEG